MRYNIIRKKGPISKKAQVEVITVMLILGITVAAVFIAYQFAVPQIERSRDVSRISSMQKAFLEFDKKIREVRFEGEGAQRYIDINFDKGNIRIDQNDDTITFYMPAPGIESAPQETGMETFFSDRTINIRLQYGGEIELLSKFEVLNPSSQRIYIKNEGGNDILLSLTAEIPITGETWTLQGYVYDNTEGGNNDGTSDEIQPSMDNNNNDKVLDAVDDAPLANAEIIFYNKKLEVVAITKTNSQGRYAVKLPKSDGVNDLELYVKTSLTSYAMKQNNGGATVYSKASLYEKDFIQNAGSWHVNINPSIGKDDNDFRDYANADNSDGLFNIPLYRLTKQDVFEGVPIALVMLDTSPNDRLNVEDTNFDNLLFDVMDAFDNTAGSSYHCNYFVVYGSVDSPQGIATGGGTWLQYPDTSETIYIYPIEWLLDPDSGKGPKIGEYGTFDPFSKIATIDGNPDVLNYKDFSLILVASGSSNDISLDPTKPNSGPNPKGLLEKLHTYQNELSSFLALDRISFNGVDYSRGIVTFAQFSEVDTTDPDQTPRTEFYPDVSSDRMPPSVTNVFIAPDGQDGYNAELPLATHPKVYINGTTGGKIFFAANVKDANEILSVVAIVKQGATELGGTILLDNGLGVDRVAGDGMYSGEWALPASLSSGIFDVSIETMDEYGNSIVKSTYLSPETLTYQNYQFILEKDIVAPIEINPVVIYPSNITTSNYVYVNASVRDTASGIDRIMYGSTRLNVQGSPSYNDTHTWYFINGIIEGNTSYPIETYDRAGNTFSQTFTVLKDTTAPSIYNINTTVPPNIVITYGDSGVGVKSGGLYIDGTLLGIGGLGSTEIAIAPVLDQGSHSGVIYVDDNIDNLIATPFQFIRISAGPSLVINSPSNFLTFTNSTSIVFNVASPVSYSYYLNGVSYVPALPDTISLGADGLYRITVIADGTPGGSVNNSYLDKWVIRDQVSPTLSIIRPLASSPQFVKPGGNAYLTFNYGESNPASYNITISQSGIPIGTKSITLNSPATNSVVARGNRTIIEAIPIALTAQAGLCDVQITMNDLAGNSNTIVSAGLFKIDSTGPSISVVRPALNSWATPTYPIEINITDVNAGVDRKSIRMYILGESNSTQNTINVEVTPDLNVTPFGPGYRVIYKPSWPYENIKRINFSIEASDKLGNLSTTSSFYLLSSNSPNIINTNISTERAGEGQEVQIGLDITQCVCELLTPLPATKQNFDAITELRINIGELGQIIYYADGNQGDISKLKLDVANSIPGVTPVEISVSPLSTGACLTCTDGISTVTMTEFRYNFNVQKVKFKVPDFAGDTYNDVYISTKNYSGTITTNTEDLYLITTKTTETVGGTTYTYGKYSWLPSLESTDLSIGDISDDPIGERYKIYGQRFDAHRRFPVLFVSGSGVDNPYYVDDSGNSIEWDHGNIPLTFSKTRPGGTLTIDLSTRQNNIEKYSLENSIMNKLPNEFPLCVHGYFDTTDTGWTSNNFMLREKTFTKIFEERGSGSSVTIPAANGGPILLIRERRNSSNELISSIVVTTADLDRYKNNRQAYGSNMHEVEVYGDLARNLESNIIIWACGHELLVEG